jgi:hypothetical protein
VKAGVTFKNTSETEPLVSLHYFGPKLNPTAPTMGAYWKNKFRRGVPTLAPSPALRAPFLFASLRFADLF